MAPTNDWHSIIAAELHHLPPDDVRQLREIGFIVMPGPAIQGGCEQLSDLYDHEVATADPADVHLGRTGSSTRIDDFVNRGSEFDGIYIYPPLLAALLSDHRRAFQTQRHAREDTQSWRID